MKKIVITALCCLSILSFVSFAWAAPVLSLGHITVKQGETGNINLSISGGDAAYAGFNARVIIPDGVTINGVSKGDLLPLEKFSLAYNVESIDGKTNLFLLAFSGEHTFGQTDGVLAVIDISVQEDAESGKKDLVFASDNPNPLVNSKHALSNEQGSASVAHTVLNGSVTISGTTIDSDNDTLPDDWEITHFGDLNQNGDGDFDKDGVTNSQELANGTSPVNPDWQNPGNFENSMTVYAKVNSDDGIIETEGSKLAAFKGDECRGVTSIGQGPSGKLFQLTVVSNLVSESGITFQVYDAQTKLVYDIQEDLSFAPNSFVGSISSPETFNVKVSVAQQNIPIVKGWNWISFNTLPEDRSPDSVLKEFVPLNNDIIKTSPHLGGSATYFDGKWYGLGNAGIKPGAMYLFNTGQQNPEVLLIEGQPVNIQDPVEIVSGWNWLGYTPRSIMTPDAALSSLDSSDNDVIKTSPNHGGTATFYGDKWYGLAQGLKPGVGYLLKSATIDSLVYPAGSTAKTTQGRETYSTPPVWQNPSGLQYTMTVHAKLKYESGAYIEVDNSLLAAFKGDVCRGVIAIATGPAGKWFQIAVGSDAFSETGLQFKIYDATTGKISSIKNTFDFTANQTLGQINAPIEYVIEASDDPQPPQWSNPDNLQFTMTLHAKVKNLQTDQIIESPGSLLGAFKDDICRGVVALADGPAGKWFQLSIGSNESVDPDFSFKVYDAGTGEIYPLIETLEFKTNEIKGTIISPELLQTTDPVPDIPGDIDGNGVIDLSDFSLVMKLLSHTSSTDFTIKGDTDNDGKIGIVDAIYILNNQTE